MEYPEIDKGRLAAAKRDLARSGVTQTAFGLQFDPPIPREAVSRFFRGGYRCLRGNGRKMAARLGLLPEGWK